MGPMIDIFLPPDGKMFTVHREVLHSRCHLLEQALSQHEIDGDCVGLSLSCGTPESFAVILKWVYTQALHYVKTEDEVLRYIDATNLALALGIWDILDPLCDRVKTFYEHNTMCSTVINAIGVLPDDCKLHNALIKLAAATLCDSARPSSTRSFAGFESFVVNGGTSVLSLVKELVGTVIYEEDMNYGLVRRLARKEGLSEGVEHASVSEGTIHRSADDHTSEDSQLTIASAAFCVIASNLPPGTTKDEIEDVIAYDSINSEGSNALLSCKITSEDPLVTAELVFSERDIAEYMVKLYDGYHADGEVLKFVLN